MPKGYPGRRRKIAGVYLILNTNTGRIYIGSSINTQERWWNHISHLRMGCHRSKHLQQDYYSFGEESFQFVLLEEIDDKTQRLSREQFWLDTSSPEYNSWPSAYNATGFEHSSETRHKMSLSAKIAQNNPDTILLKKENARKQWERMRSLKT